MTNNIIVAIDETDMVSIKRIIDSLDHNKCLIKVGSVSYNSVGKEAIYFAAERGFDIFLDLKLHDIPNTVKKTILGLSSLPISILTIHTSGGLNMMNAAMDAVAGSNIKVFGVTALTSLSDKDTNIIYQRTSLEHVHAMLDLAEKADIHGVVCSPHEVEIVRKTKKLLSITPGIRLYKSNDDQTRVMTPKEDRKSVV